MNVKPVQPTFGMALYKTKDAELLIKHLGIDRSSAIETMRFMNEDCPVSVVLSVVNDGGRQLLKAEVGHKSFVENAFHGPVSTVERGVSYARKMSEILQRERNMTKGMYIPRLH